MSIETLNIPLEGFIKQGDTIPKITLTFSDGYTGDLTTATIKMQVYNDKTKIIDISDGSGITAVSATVMEIDERAATEDVLPYGTFNGDLEVTEADGVVSTYFNVKYTILKQYTV